MWFDWYCLLVSVRLTESPPGTKVLGDVAELHATGVHNNGALSYRSARRCIPAAAAAARRPH